MESRIQLLIKNLLFSSEFYQAIAYTQLLNLGYSDQDIIKKAIEFGFLKEEN